MIDVSVSSNQGAVDFDFIESLSSECFMPFSYGGGISSVEEAVRILRLGAEKIILQTSVIREPKFLSEVSRAVGASSVIVSIDVRKNPGGSYSVYKNRGRELVDIELMDLLNRVQAGGAGEILLTSIDRESERVGYDLELIEKVSAAINIPLIANGGAASVQDFALALNAGASAVAAGTLFSLYGKFRAPLISYPTDIELVQAGVP